MNVDFISASLLLRVSACEVQGPTAKTLIIIKDSSKTNPWIENSYAPIGPLRIYLPKPHKKYRRQGKYKTTDDEAGNRKERHRKKEKKANRLF